MITYIREIKRQFRDKYNMVPSGGADSEPLFDNIPDGVYPMQINGKTDYVEIKGMDIKCCNFKAPSEAE